MVHQVENSEDFANQLQQAEDKLVVVDFFATWCGPCKMISPHIEEMSKIMEDVVFLKVDVDECEEIAQEYKITAMPTFIFIKSKEKVGELTGANVDKLKEMVASNK
ncbi:thioredoxin-2-like [Eurytemora carolleeae]|uniref:thioredoxin-2-like n=1 Tax=Eurytemora carolleeae TaxID=1294199 RepID=UPI000C75E3EA|nr:thioredoxin-2-like [Eurytemora carolleeae]|eukprot:XP_023324773.1 thioredoxin-2-like [Eurytemora affinis]